jgi:predicted small lipoprotein YifL
MAAMSAAAPSSVATPLSTAARAGSAVLVAALAFLAAGCGQKGPLMLPSAAKAPAPAASSASAPLR